MTTLLHIALAIAALAVPIACAYLVVCRMARRNSRGRTPTETRDPVVTRDDG